MDLKIHQRNSNGTYGPNSGGQYYVSKEDHRRTSLKSEHKTRWCIEEGQEFEVFRLSSENRWYCKENDSLFAIVDDGKLEVGMDGERIAKFPKLVNDEDPWHGYPVSCAESQNTPSDDLLDKWEQRDIITATTKKRIEKRKI